MDIHCMYVYLFFTFLSSYIHQHPHISLIIFSGNLSIFKIQIATTSLPIMVSLCETVRNSMMKSFEVFPNFLPFNVISSIHAYISWHLAFIHQLHSCIMHRLYYHLIFPRTSFCFDGENKPQACFEYFFLLQTCNRHASQLYYRLMASLWIHGIRAHRPHKHADRILLFLLILKYFLGSNLF